MADRERPATKIVATVGPASRDEATLRALIEAGVDVFRLNFSHGTTEEHAEISARIRRLAEAMDEPIAILQDLQGPKIRVGELVGGEPVLLPTGAQVTLTGRDLEGTSSVVPTTYQGLAHDAQPGSHLLLDDGAMELEVLDKTDTDVLCKVVRGGLLKEHKGINLPGLSVSAPALTQKDLADLRAGVDLDVDYIALSFVRSAEDIELARKYLQEAGSSIPLIAKLEKPEAVAHLDEIIAVSDGVMIARGDLGVEMPTELVPLIQKDIIDKALMRRVPTITATQMLESMVTSPRPTRAEASDVANAILDGTDAVMLSAETASGRFPVEAVQIMHRIAVETCRSGRMRQGLRGERLNPVEALSNAARYLAEDLPQVCAVVPLTNSGYTAHLMSSARIRAPIWAYTYTEKVRRSLALWWGVHPMLMPNYETTEELMAWVERDLLDRRYVNPGSMIVITGGMPIPGPTQTNFVKLQVIGEAG